MKTCPKCKEEKPLRDFYKFKGGRRSTYCKPCEIARVDEYQQNSEKRREYFKKYQKEYIGRPYVKFKRKRKRTTPAGYIMNAARSKVSRAKAAGIISPPETCEFPTCEFCNREKLLAHHYLGYRKENWLDVKWVCPKHHRLIHMSNYEFDNERS